VCVFVCVSVCEHVVEQPPNLDAVEAQQSAPESSAHESSTIHAADA